MPGEIRQAEHYISHMRKVVDYLKERFKKKTEKEGS
jgi:hypothetical protein